MFSKDEPHSAGRNPTYYVVSVSPSSSLCRTTRLVSQVPGVRHAELRAGRSTRYMCVYFTFRLVREVSGETCVIHVDRFTRRSRFDA